MGEVISNLSINFWLKFLILLAIYVIYYFIVKAAINRLNGGIKRKPFFLISFMLLILGASSFTFLYIFDYIPHYSFDAWTVTYLAYFLLVELFAILFALIRAYKDKMYCCSHCKRFGVNLFTDKAIDRQMHKYQKPILEMHSEKVYAGTNVTTKTEWQEADGKMVDGSLKTNVYMEDKYNTNYYTTTELRDRAYVVSKGTMRCKKCGYTNSYNSVDSI